MKQRKVRLTILLMSLVFSCPAFAQEQDINNLGTFGDWRAYAYVDESGKVCYLAGKPKKSDSEQRRRGDVFLMVTHRPGVTNEVSALVGYSVKSNSKVVLAVGDQKFDLFSEDDTAWAKDAKVDAAIIAALNKGTAATIDAMPVRGAATKDNFSLAGFSKAYKAINDSCGIKG